MAMPGNEQVWAMGIYVHCTCTPATMPGQTKYLPLGAQSVAYSFVQSTLCKKTGLYFLKCSSTIYMAVHLMCKACVCAPTFHQQIQPDPLTLCFVPKPWHVTFGQMKHCFTWGSDHMTIACLEYKKCKRRIV